MAKASENKSSPFKPFIESYEDLIQQMQDSTSHLEITKLTKDIRHTLKQLYKAMMAFYEQQHQKNLKYLAENKQHLEKISKKTITQAESMLDRSLKQSQALMEKQMEYLKHVYRLQPKEFLEQAIDHANSTFNEQNKVWQEFYQAQKEDIQENMETFESEAKRILKQSDTLREDMLAFFHELEERFHELLAKKQNEAERHVHRKH